MRHIRDRGEWSAQARRPRNTPFRDTLLVSTAPQNLEHSGAKVASAGSGILGRSETSFLRVHPRPLASSRRRQPGSPVLGNGIDFRTLLQHERPPPLLDAVDLCDVGVIEGRQNLRLPLEPDENVVAPEAGAGGQGHGLLEPKKRVILRPRGHRFHSPAQQCPRRRTYAFSEGLACQTGGGGVGVWAKPHLAWRSCAVWRAVPGVRLDAEVLDDEGGCSIQRRAASSAVVMDSIRPCRFRVGTLAGQHSVQHIFPGVACVQGQLLLGLAVGVVGSCRNPPDDAGARDGASVYKPDQPGHVGRLGLCQQRFHLSLQPPLCLNKRRVQNGPAF